MSNAWFLSRCHQNSFGMKAIELFSIKLLEKSNQVTSLITSNTQ